MDENLFFDNFIKQSCINKIWRIMSKLSNKYSMSTNEYFIESAIRYIEIYGLKNEVTKFYNERSEFNGKESLTQNHFMKRFSLIVDMIYLSDISIPLVQLIMDNIELAENIFVEALEFVIKPERITGTPPLCFSSDDELEYKDTPYLSFQLKGIPATLFSNSQYTVKFRPSCRLILFRGVVISVTPLLKHIRKRKYAYSTSSYNENNKLDKNTALRDSFSFHPSTYVTKSDEKNLGDFIEAVFMPKPAKSLENEISYSPFTICSGISIRFYDDLAPGIRLGEEYNIAASMTEEGMKGYYAQKTMSAIPLNSFTYPKIHSIMYLKEKMASSPWAFFVALASQLSSDMYPRSSFLNLKRGLLLSLVSIGCPSCPIPVFAVGPEFIPAHRLMVHASTLASKTVRHSCHQLITGKVRWQEEQFGKSSAWIDAGSLILAQGGVCYIGDWTKNKNETHSAILSAIEKREINIPAGKAVPISDMSFPLQSAIWVYGSIKKANKLHPLIDIFGIPFTVNIDSKEEDQVIDVLIQHSYDNLTKCDNFGIQDEELKMITRSFKVTISPKAAQLIQDYFVASRRCRGIANPEECLPIRAVDIITQMSEAHARLYLHSTVTQEDALAAICICEEAMSAIYGQTQMSAPPPLRISETTWTNFISEVDYHMKQFDYWIRRFIKDLIGESSSNMTREE